MKNETSPPSEELMAFLAWQRIPGIGKQLLLKIRDHFGSFLFAWQATYDQDPQWQAILSKTQAPRRSSSISNIYQEIIKDNPQFITLIDQDYPKSLLTSYPEPILYYRGNRELLKAKIPLAIVGSRRFDHYNASALKSIFSALAGAPITIISGLALGIDGLAHQLALEYHLPTIAIPGSSVADDEVYPRTHLQLSRLILANNGLLLSPFPHNTLIENHLFPYRNALIAGLCQAILVVSAASRSGALITAQLASDFGRDILAIPGNIHQELSQGTNKLIQQGATPIMTGQDILRHFGLTSHESSGNEYASATALEEKIIKILRFQHSSAEDLMMQLPEITTSQIIATLTGMELKRWIEKTSSHLYRLL